MVPTDRTPDGFRWTKGHRIRLYPYRRPVRAPDPAKLKSDLEDLLKRYPIYREDGTAELLETWRIYNPARLRWFIRHCG